MEWHSEIHPGKVRDNQEDALCFWPNSAPSLFVVADGLGGHPDGEVASSSASQAMITRAEEKNNFSSRREFRSAFNHAERTIQKLNQGKDELDRMATTLTAVSFRNSELWCVHMGDTRLYRLRKGKLKQLTKDHASGPHTLNQALGFSDKQRLHSFKYKIKEKDEYLLCSDGLYGMVSDSLITEILTNSNTCKSASDSLLTAALDAGGHDNISFFVIRI